jgi:glycosyltransferase involved in cell wall biosynthesis
MTIDIAGTSSLHAATTIVRCAVPYSTVWANIHMHIRHLVCTENFAGVERYIASTAAELARRGNTVEVIGGATGPMQAALRTGRATHIAASSFRSVARANLQRARPDLVHAHMTAADMAAVATRPLVRRPIVSTLHFAHPRGHDALTRRLYVGLRPFISREIATSRVVADAFGGQVEVMHSGIPRPAPTLVGRERAPVVMVVQRLEAEKRTATALRAFAEAGLADAGWELHLAGDGAERASLEHLARDLGIASVTTFLGHVDDVEPRLATASILIAPTPNEAFGLAVVEAMSLGLPVVASDGGGHRETVGSATPELMFPPSDVAVAAQLLTRLASEPTLRADVGRRNVAAYERSFTIEAHVDRLEALYRRVLSG